MKRTGDWGRKKPLSNRTPLARSKPLTGSSTPITRNSPLPRARPSKPAGPVRSKPLSSARPKQTAEERLGRKQLRARSGGLCEMCGRRPATDAHHRRNRSQGGTWEITNLLHLCHQDHMTVTVSPALAYERGWSVRSTDDPARVPAWLAGRGFTYLTADGGLTERSAA